MSNKCRVSLLVLMTGCFGLAAYAQDDPQVRKELEAQYKRLAEAHDRQDLKAIVGLKTADFHAIFPDGRVGDSKVMEQYSEQFLEGNQPPYDIRVTIQTLSVSENKLIAVAEVLQEATRYRELAGKRRKVDTSVLQRETWSKTAEGWKLKVVDSVRDQKRFVDGKRVDPSKPYNPDDPPYEQAPPRLMFIYRDSLKQGVDSAYRAIEEDAARICTDLKCPNPYLALESLSGPHEAWWLNAFAGEADTTRVSKAYAANRPLMDALGTITKRKEPMIGTPISGFAFFRAELSRGPAWSVAGARFMVVTVTRNRRPAEGSVWEMADSTMYVLRPAKTRGEAESLASGGARIFAIRPSWSMPAPEWVAADSGFWRPRAAG